ncbi:MAG: UDP-N-acetylmuramoyl-L-alanyl-D-glutamate--2,6-diaminopimelate ligase [Acidimicrobiia bacterium]
MLLRDLVAPEGPLADAEVLGSPAPADLDVTSVAHDSRAVAPGALFACIPGELTDGHDHAPDAVAAGAVALLVDRPLDLDVVQILVGSVRAGLGPAAAAVEGNPSRHIVVVGVTGTNGKTSTTLLLESVFTAAGLRPGVVGTLGARIAGEHHPGARTTPEAPDLQRSLAMMRASGVEAVAMEVSSHALEQHRVDGTWFTAACFTNLSHEHLDYHGTLEAYFEAKAALFTPDHTGAAALNVDDAHGRVLRERLEGSPLDVATFGETTPATWSTAAVRSTGWTTSFTLLREGQGVGTVTLALPGAWNRQNALAAAATAALAGVPADSIVAGLSRRVPIPGRLERITEAEPFDVVVDYAHTPDALARVLDTARSLARGRVRVVVGCGGDRDRGKRPLMGRAAAQGADEVIITSDNPRSEDPGDIARAVAEGARASGAEPLTELDRRRAVYRAIEDAEPGDIVVIAGKGHEQGQEIHGELVPFDDREVARRAIEELR